MKASAFGIRPPPGGEPFVGFHEGREHVSPEGVLVGRLAVGLAIGALEREVLLQFLIEAVVLACLGGLIGIVLATGASLLLSSVMQVPYLFNPGVNLLSFGFSAGIGVLFGYFPARRAARLDPIEALRHE